MSAVRMCDKCGNIFPEGEEGAGIYSGSRNVRDDRGFMRSVSTQMDVCKNCNGFQGDVQPRVAIAHIEGQAATE